ncbi:MAG: fumarylacetoacetate hydrolase family protein [Planctomycetota bacterium]|nr:fumarylacetoacetate hydrolase family protein [Planctomycetota bacterium]
MSEAIRIYRVPTLSTPRTVALIDGHYYDIPPEHQAPTTTPRVLREFLSDGGLVECDAPEGELLPPIDPSRVGKIMCLGKNFHAHAAEFGEEVPTDPLFFNKLPETIVGHGSTVQVPAHYSGRFDHEAELAVIIGKGGVDIPLEEARSHVAGYSVANDLTARHLQGEDRERGWPWFRAKNFPGSCPLGPCFIPATELNADDLAITCHVNDELRQDSRTSLMVIPIDQAIAHLSTYLALNAGDIILMGTPAGVGPLVEGDQVTCTIEEIGAVSTKISR